MTDDEKRVPTVDAQDVSNMRHNVSLLRSQIQSGRVDGGFLARQVDKLADLLERVEADHKQRRQAARFEALYNVTRLLGTSLDLNTVLDQVMDAILQLTGAERGLIVLRDDDGTLRVTTARNFDQQPLTDDKRSFSNTIVNQVVDRGEPVVTTNAVEDPRFEGQASIVSQGVRRIMATPLRARGRILGVVYVDNRAVAGLFEDDDLAALDAFAGQAAMAIDNARLFRATDQQLQQRLDELTQLRRIDMQLSETLDAKKAMQITLEWACRLSGAHTGYVGLVEHDPPRVRTMHSYGMAPGQTQPIQLHVVYPATLEVASNGKTAVVPGRRSGAVTSLIVPVRRENKVIAVVVLNRTGSFSESEQDLVERVVARAAVAIENARLYAEVQAADFAKSEFVGVVAHDLKVPMASILGYAELTLLDDDLNPRQIDFQQRIRDIVLRMEVLVSDLADISRLESGHFYMDVTRVPVEDIVQAVKDSMYTQLTARGHQFEQEIGADLPELEIDYYRLLQVLTNLMSNAIKYTPDGGRITLRVRRANHGVMFSIQDNGIGLTPDGLMMLGTKFWRADDDFTRSQPGTGLGFAITRSLVQQMGGKIRVESEPGKGSTFSFYIPAAPASP
jgi:signal transduction histidine kinase